MGDDDDDDDDDDVALKYRSVADYAICLHTKYVQYAHGIQYILPLFIQCC
jgi:hypothetical protein